MIKLLGYFVFVISLASNIYSQNLTESLAKSFIEFLIEDSKNLEKFVHIDELNNCKRLNISYNGEKHKFLISNNLSPSIKLNLKKSALKYNITVDSLEHNYSVLTFEVPSKNIKREYYFYKSKLISKPYYFSREWDGRTSKYFKFYISDPNYFNEYCLTNLDEFVEKMLRLLKFNEAEINKLEEEKIHYFLCKDQNEIELLTGYKARGLYYLPYDYIISTFNCHYHEILHLLMNYKLQKVDLYTLPFLQEGFAVAYGGRGGKKTEVILEMGNFLAVNNFLDYKSLLSKSDFYQYDVSMTYPLSGLYCNFLIKTIGVNQFIELYKKYSGDNDKINQQKINLSELPSDLSWQKYLEEHSKFNAIRVAEFEEKKFRQIIIEAENLVIKENKNEYLIKLKSSFEIVSNKNFENYKSKLFYELFPTRQYQNQKYIISANTDEVSVYNLYSNLLIAKYVKGFSTKNESVKNENGFFVFTIKKTVFDEALVDENIIRVLK